MKYAITYKQDGIEKANFKYTEKEVAKEWMKTNNGVDSLDREIQGEDGNGYEAGFDGEYFLNELP